MYSKILPFFLLIFILSIRTLPVLASEIHDAVQAEDLSKIKVLLEKNSSLINAQDDNEYTPLHYGAYKGNKDIVKFLISMGAKVNFKGKYGITPLHTGASGGSKEIVELLLKNGGNVNDKDKFGVTILHYGILSGNKEIVKFLLSMGAKVNAKIEDGVSPLYFATGFMKNFYRRVDILLGRNPGKVGYEYYIPLVWLHDEIYNGDKDIAELLISNGADLNAKDENGFTPLHYVSSKELAGLLISKGAKVNSKGKNNISPLHCAVFSYDKEIVEVLLANGADINAKTVDGKTPLSYAIDIGYKEIEDILRKSNKKK